MHGLGFQRLRGVEVVGVCDVNPARSHRLAQRLSSRSHNSIESLLTAGIDLAAVCTREWQHWEVSRQLLEAGVDVFSEKILVTRVQQGRDLIQLARRMDRCIGVNYNYRFMPGIAELHRLIASGELGRLQLLTIDVHAFSYHHGIDLMCYLAGPTRIVSAELNIDNRRRPFGGTDWNLYDEDIPYVPNNAAITFRLANGAVGVINSSYDLPATGFILAVHAVLDNGVVALIGINNQDVVGELSILTQGRIRRLRINDYAERPFSRGYEYCFAKSIEAFMQSYVTRSQPPTSGEWGLKMIELERAIWRSSHTGDKVAFDSGQ